MENDNSNDMQPQPSHTLALLLQALQNPTTTTLSQNYLLENGCNQVDVETILYLNDAFRQTNDELDYLKSEANKPIIEKQISQSLLQLDQMTESAKNTMELVGKLKNSLINNATGTLAAYNRVLLIYTIAFVLGILLVITGVVFGAMGKEILAISFGAIGLIDIFVYFIKLPANKIQESRSNLSQLQVVLLVWLKDLINNEAVTAKLLNVPKPSIEDYKSLSEININNTEKLLRMIEEMAEPKN